MTQTRTPGTSLATRVAPGISDALRGYLERMQPTALLTPANEAEAWDMAVRALQISTAGAITAGYQFKRLRAQLPAGGFSAGLAERQIPRRTAYDAIEAFDLFSAFPEIELCELFAQLGLSRVRCLSALSLDEFLALAAGQEVRGITYEQAADISVRDLDAHLKEWQANHDTEANTLREQLKRAQTEAEVARLEATALRRQLGQEADVSPSPAWYRSARREISAVCEGLSLYLAEAQRVSQELIFAAPGWGQTDCEFRTLLATLGFHQLRGLYSGLAMLLSDYERAFSGQLDDATHPLLKLDDDERMALLEHRQRIVGDIDTGRKKRAVENAADVPRTRGRPPGAKNKPKAKA
ncbi:MAG: hypothetical protein ACT4QA_23090 [Panacagrimonas sp.]